MFAHVLLLNGFSKELTYSIPEKLVPNIRVGSIVQVPLRALKVPALVILLYQDADPTKTFKIKEILSCENFPQDNSYYDFMTKVSQFYFVPVLHFYQRLKKFLDDKKREEITLNTRILTDTPEKLITLTHEQEQVVSYLAPVITNPRYKPTLLHGVTGSGKTEVYKKLLQIAHETGKTSIVLLPEVSLSMQFEALFKKTLPNIDIFGFHSASTITEKRALWQALIIGKPVIIIGVHLPIILPIKNLGLIIIDEEHEQGFIEKKSPKVNSKEIAIWRASTYNIPILLGSATPSLHSLENVKKHQWQFMQITKRFAGTFPTIEKVILSELSKAKKRPYFWITPTLARAIQACLDKKEQVIIYLNRRGYSFFVQCKTCGFIFQCPHCSVSLTLHQERTKNDLRCHYCNFTKSMPVVCPECTQPESQFIKKGLGTQQVVQILQDLFPAARIARADLDSTSKKRAWQNTVTQFEHNELDILVGTQTITKGYHFPHVTLIGILWADLNLHFPLYNAAETTIQQLIQVAGRAGRSRRGSKVIVQALKDHPIFDYLNEETYLKFCAKEILDRQEMAYPPCGRLTQIEFRHKEAAQATLDATLCAKFLKEYAQTHNSPVSILGPALPLVSKMHNIEIRTILLKSQTYKHIHELVYVTLAQKYTSDIVIAVG